MDDVPVEIAQTVPAEGAGGAFTNILAFGVGTVIVLLMIIFALVLTFAMWRLYRKAGKPGWASIVPIYNIYVKCQIAGKPTWWTVVVMFVPIVGVVFEILLMLDFVRAYGKDTLYGVLTIFFPFITVPIMAYDNNVRYVGPAGSGYGMQPQAAAVPPFTPPTTPVQ